MWTDLDDAYLAIFGTHPSAAPETVSRMRHVVYLPAERPDVEVLVDGDWFKGELRMWTQRDDGSWWGQVQYRRAPGATFLDGFAADRVRKAPPLH